MSTVSRKSIAGAGRSKLLLLLVGILVAPGVPVPEARAYSDCFASVTEIHITDNGDGDGYADTNETLTIGFSVESHCEGGLEDCVARLDTESPAIECKRRPEIFIGDLPATGPAVTPEETFEIKIGNVDRDDLGAGPDDPLEATLSLWFSCRPAQDQYWYSPPEEIVLPLDLNLSDQGQTAVPWNEDFESGTLGQFSPQNNDAGLPGENNEEGLENADGWRCQYVDPDWINSETYNQAQGETCYPGMNLAHANAIFWQVDGATVAESPDGGRAKSGLYSMYYGIFLDQPNSDLFTTPHSTVEAVGTTEPINLGTGSPRLEFWQQVSLVDGRHFQGGQWNEYHTFDRGVVQIQLTDVADSAPGVWQNLRTAVNPYYGTMAENHWMCAFDPIDDGNTEDDFFDPTDPVRDTGPSSTCSRPKTWSYQGDTSPAPFDVGNVGHASTPPAASDAPSLGSGTWVRTELDLTPYRGHRARIRFLVTSLKYWNGSPETWNDLFGDLEEKDDGWWIDDIVIDETLTESAHFSNDEFMLGSCTGTGESCIGQCRLSLAPCSDASPCGEGDGDCLSPCPPGEACSGPPPDCGANCSQAEANLFLVPDGPLNPGTVTTSEPDERVDLRLAASYDETTGAEPSWVDVCIDGFQEYRSCPSGDPDGDGPGAPDADCDDPWDGYSGWYTSWTTSSRRSYSPEFDTTYAFEVRCSSAPDCRAGRTLEIIVQCPSRNPNTLGLQEVRALNRQMLTWRGPLDVDWLRGSFSSGADVGDYIADFTDTRLNSTSIPMDGDPPAGTGYYYLVKRDGPVHPFQVYVCDTVTWRSGGTAETNEPARNGTFGNQ